MKRYELNAHKARIAINVLREGFVCCGPGDYEAGCISCEALRIVGTLESMIADGDITPVRPRAGTIAAAIADAAAAMDRRIAAGETPLSANTDR